MAVDRQPMNLDLLKQMTDELMAPVSTYRHARAEPVDPPYTQIEKRPRKISREAKRTQRVDGDDGRGAGYLPD